MCSVMDWLTILGGPHLGFEVSDRLIGSSNLAPCTRQSMDGSLDGYEIMNLGLQDRVEHFSHPV